MAAEELSTDGAVIDVSIDDSTPISPTAESATTPTNIAPPSEQTPAPSEPSIPAAAASPDLAAVRQMMVSMGIGGSELAAIEALMRSGSGKFATDVTETTPAVEPGQPSATTASPSVESGEANVAPIADAPAATSETPAEEALAAAADIILKPLVAETEIPVVVEGVVAAVPADESSSQAGTVQAEVIQADAIQSGPDTVVTETEDGSKVSITSTSDASGDLETIDIKIEGSVATIEELLQALRQKGGAVDVKVDVALESDSPASSDSASASASSDDASSSPTEVDVTATVVSPAKPLPPVVFRSPAELTMAVRDKMTLSWRDPVPVVQQLVEAVAAAAAAAATTAEAVDSSEGSSAASAAERPAPAVGPSVAPAGCGVEITLEESTGGRTYLLTLQPGSDLMDVAEHVANLHVSVRGFRIAVTRLERK